MLERGKMDRDLVEFVVIDQLVPRDHLLRKIDAAVGFNRLYEMVEPLYSEDNGRPSIDPVVLFKMVLIQHLFGIASLRQTYREIQVNVAGRSMQSAKSWGRSRSRTMTTTIRRIPAAEKRQKRRSPQQIRTAECS